MNFHADATDATSLIKLFSSAFSVVKEAKELVNGVRDEKLKEKVNDAFASLLDIREKLLEYTEQMRLLEQENLRLQSDLARREAIDGPIPPFGYVYRAGDRDHPLCPKCYQGKQSVLSYMTSLEEWNRGQRRKCPICDWMSYEVPMDLRPGRIVPRVRPYMR